MKRIISIVLLLSFVMLVFCGCDLEGFSSKSGKSSRSKKTSISEMELSEDSVTELCEKIVKEFNKNGDFEAELDDVEVVQYKGPYVEAEFLITSGLSENQYEIEFYPVSETDALFSRAYISGYRGDTNDTRIEEHQLLVSAFEEVVFGESLYEEQRESLQKMVYNDMFEVNENCEISYSITDTKDVSYTAEIYTNYGRCDFFDYKVYK